MSGKYCVWCVANSVSMCAGWWSAPCIVDTYAVVSHGYWLSALEVYIDVCAAFARTVLVYASGENKSLWAISSIALTEPAYVWPCVFY